MRLRPGPDVAVMAFAPDHEAPHTAEMEPISSSIWMKAPLWSGSSFARFSMISDEGVMG
jgi:hypothetical protein